MHKILIIDDEKDICFLISEILKDENFITYSAINSDEAIAKYNKMKPDLIILDVWLSKSKLDGIELLRKFKEIQPNIPIIIISGHGTVDLAVNSIKSGAYDFLEKPFNSDKLIILTKRAIESSNLVNENKNLKNLLSSSDKLIGQSIFIKKIEKKIYDHSNSKSRLLIHGSFGTGKKLLSNLIHANSKFREKLPVVIDFNKLSNQNIESLLNDDEKYLNENLFIRSNNNTLILINIDQLAINYQKKLLFFIENGSFFARYNVKLHQKIISITKKKLEEEIKKGNFLSRLYERINTENIFCPNISERREDIVPILEYYINNFYNQDARKITFSDSAKSKLELYDWPGNISQMINYIEKTIILNQGIDKKNIFELDDLALEMGDFENESFNNNLDLSLKDARSEFEKEYLLSQIKRFNGNMSKVSQYTGMERTALYRKIKSLKISLN